MWSSVVANWVSPRCTLESVVPNGSPNESHNVTVTSPCSGLLLERADGKFPVPTRVENIAPQPLSSLAPGNFYHDRAKKLIYYSLLPHQTPADLEDAWAPLKEDLLVVKDAQHVSWANVQFSYGTWFGVNDNTDGYVPRQTAVRFCTPGKANCNSPFHHPPFIPAGFAEPYGNVRLHNTTHVLFQNCTFSHLGGIYALSIGDASKDASVLGCTFLDLSGGFLKLGNTDDARAISPNPKFWDSNFTVSQNFASGMALEYLGAASLFAGYVAYTTIDHNTLGNCGYSGISIGWGWGRVKSWARNNAVTYNYVYDVMLSLVDGGSIYHLGPQRNSVHKGNYVTGDRNKFGALYFDNGSEGWEISECVVNDAPLAWAFFSSRMLWPTCNRLACHGCLVSELVTIREPLRC